MKWKDWLEKWGMTSLKIKTPFLDMQWEPQDADKDAAWDLYIELLTRITTQRIRDEHGDEKTALDSIHSLFPTTRAVLKNHGRKCIEFTKIAIVVLNQIVRPFTAKWHKLSLENAFEDRGKCSEFRKELETLQDKLSTYTQMLGNMAGVEEDLVDLQEDK